MGIGPLVGGWLSRHASEPSNPGFLGMPGYVTGNEHIEVASFAVPDAARGLRFSVVAAADGAYELRLPEGGALGQGRVGQPMTFSVAGGSGELTIRALHGLPGAEFFVTLSSRLPVVESLQSQLKIAEKGRQSGVITVSLQGDDPRHLQRVLNEVATLYVRQNVERKSAEAEKSLGFLDKFLPQLRRELEQSESEFNRFRAREGTFDLGAEAQGLLQKTTQLQSSVMDLQQKRRELSQRYTNEHPQMRAIDAQIRAAQAELGKLTAATKKLPDLEQDLLRLTREVKVNTGLYTSLLNSLQQLQLVKEGKVGNVRLVDAAEVPLYPVAPNRPQHMAVATLLGLLVGLAAAFLRNRFTMGIKNPSDVEAKAGLHLFATVPNSPDEAALARKRTAGAPGLHVLAQVHPKDGAVEALRSLRTSMQFAMLDAPNNVLLIAGATPSVGKSFVSVNFAAVLGDAGKRVLLLDADLRKGRLHQFLGLDRKNGFSDVVAGSVPLAQAIHREVMPRVDFLSTGALPPNPDQIFSAAIAHGVIAQLSAQYDVIIVDTAPVLVAADTAILASQAGTIFMVARSLKTHLGELLESKRRLAQTGVTVKGVVFNDLDLSRRRFGAGYGYGYGYGYGGYRYGRYRYVNYKY